jgi:hypothetical protein
MNIHNRDHRHQIAAIVAALFFAATANSEQPGPPPTRMIPVQPNMQPGTQFGTQPNLHVPQGPTRQIEGQPGGGGGGDSDEPPLPQAQRQVGQHAESADSGIQSRSGGRAPSRETIRVNPRPRIVPPGRWQLGVYFDDAPKGLRIRQVVSPSAASRFGLEVGDYLLDVMGYPLGYYNGSYYTLEGALNRLTPPDGWVNILVWNHRTGAEEALWVQLTRRGGFNTMPVPRGTNR